MDRFLIRFLFLLSTILTFLACTRNREARTLHEGPAQTNYAPTIEDTLTSNANRTLNIELLKSVYQNRFQINDELNNKNISADAALKIANNLKTLVLNQKMIDNDDWNTSKQMIPTLGLFNKALDIALSRDRAKAHSLYQEVIQVIFFNCNQDLKNCPNLLFFSQDHLSSQFVLQMALDLENQLNELRSRKKSNPELQNEYLALVAQIFKYVRAAYEIKSQPFQFKHDLIYVRLANDFFEYFNSLPLQDKKREEYRQHRDRLSLILAQIKEKNSNLQAKKEYCDFIIKVRPLNFVVDADSSLDQRGVKSFIQDFIQCAYRQKSLESIIAEYQKEHRQIDQELLEIKVKESPNDPRFEDVSYNYALSYLNSTPNMLADLNIKNESLDSVQFFSFNELFYERLDKRTAQQYWMSATKMDPKLALSFIKNYARVQTAYLAKSTAILLSNLYKEKIAEQKGLSPMFFRDVNQNLNARIKDEWSNLIRRLRLSADFLITVYDSELNRPNLPAEMRATANQYRALLDDLEFFDQHLNYVVALPLELMVRYYLSLAQGTVKVYLPWTGKDYDIPSRQALTDYFSRSNEDDDPSMLLQNSFVYVGQRTIGVSRTERLVALDFAFRMGIFDFFPLDLVSWLPQGHPAQTMKVSNPTLFFLKYLMDSSLFWESNINSLAQKLSYLKTNQDLQEDFWNQCQDPLRASVQLSLSDLYSSNLFSSTSRALAAASEISKGYDNLHYLRRLQKHFADILKVYSRHWEKRSPEELQLLSNQVQRLAEVEGRYTKLLLEHDHKIVSKEINCWKRIQKAERYRENKLLEANVAYYYNVHAAMTLMQLSDKTETAIQAWGQDQLSSLPLDNTFPDDLNSWLPELDRITMSTNEKIAAFRKVVSDVQTRMLTLLSLADILSEIVPSLVADGSVDSTATTADSRLNLSLNLILGVHNLNQAVEIPTPLDLKNIGYFVTGVPSFSQSKQSLQRLNQISPTEFSQSQWDSMMRVRSILQEQTVDASEANQVIGTNYSANEPLFLGANVEIPLGSFASLENNSYYTNKDTPRVSYSASPYSFVKSAMIQFAGNQTGGKMFFGWLSTTGNTMSLLSKRYEYLKNMFEMGAIITSDKIPPNCQRNKWNNWEAEFDYSGKPFIKADESQPCPFATITADELMNSFTDMIDFMKLSEDERYMLELVNRPETLATSVNQYFKYQNEQSTKEWTFFDNFVRRELTTVSAYTYDLEKNELAVNRFESFRGRREFEEFRNNYLKRINRTGHLFDIDPEVVSLERNRARGMILEHLKQMDQVVHWIRDLEKSKTELGPLVFEKTLAPMADNQETYLPGNWRFINADKRGDGTPIYLRDSGRSWDWIRKYVDDFFTKAPCDVIPTKYDPDYPTAPDAIEKLTSGSCWSRYKEWKESVKTEMPMMFGADHE